MSKTEKQDRSAEAREKWSRHPGDEAFECKCGRLFGMDDLVPCDTTKHTINDSSVCPGHCPYCGQQVVVRRKQ